LTDITSIEAARARIKAERERRLAERIEAGEIVSIQLFIVAGSETEARARIEETKASKLEELRVAGETREVVFSVTMVATGVLRHGEAASGEPWKPTAPPFLPGPKRDEVVEEEAVREDPQPPVIESYIYTTIHQATDTDPGAILEGWWSIDGKVLTLTGTDGKHITSRAITAGEDPKTLARELLREKRAPKEFQRRIDYPASGLA
jgi:hypothetical protein